jgi:endonuclease V-like protein UPF0215 family
MRVHADKKAIRVLGISESFVKGVSKRSVLAGVVMRGDMLIDGFAFGTAAVGGIDATDAVLNLYGQLDREDVNLLMLNGCVISWFNVIDLPKVHQKLNLPLICVTYEESDGLEKYFRAHFDDWVERVAVHEKNGARELVMLHTGYRLYSRYFGMGKITSKRVLNKFTLQGAVPEPLRVSRLLANSILNAGAIPSV